MLLNGVTNDSANVFASVTVQSELKFLYYFIMLYAGVIYRESAGKNLDFKTCGLFYIYILRPMSVFTSN